MSPGTTHAMLATLALLLWAADPSAAQDNAPPLAADDVLAPGVPEEPVIIVPEMGVPPIAEEPAPAVPSEPPEAIAEEPASGDPDAQSPNAVDQAATDAPEAEAAAASANPLSALDLESLDATRSVPLFTPSRSAPVVAAAEPEPEPEPEPEVVEEVGPELPPLQLIGIVMTDAEQVALLADQGTGEVHRFKPGEEYEGWKLAIVDARTVEFSNAEQVHKLTMFTDYTEPPPTPQFQSPDMQGINGNLEDDQGAENQPTEEELFEEEE